MKNDRPSQATPVPLNPNAAFVVHLTNPDAADATAANGRVEHVTSGRSLRFTSTMQLIDFMNRVAGRLGKEGGALALAMCVVTFAAIPAFADDDCSMKARDEGGAYTVPSGVTMVRITAYGHSGEPGVAVDSWDLHAFLSRRGGAGSKIVAFVPVTAGDVLQRVAIDGGAAGAGGDKYGEKLPLEIKNYGKYGTRGGAATGVVRVEPGCRRFLVVAGGGGGNGSEGFDKAPRRTTDAGFTRGLSSSGGRGDQGPGAGATEGQAGHDGRNDREDGAGGGPGVTDPATGGFVGAGGHTPGLCPNGNPGQAGGFESAGAGGNGPDDTGDCDPRAGGGGGGGGYHGGGGGGSPTVNGGAGAGGGGSSYVTSTATSVTYSAHDGTSDTEPFSDLTPGVSIDPLYTGVTVTVTGSPNPGFLNVPVTYTATVTANGTMPADLPQVPTGTVTFLETFSIGTADLVNGVATLSKTYTGGVNLGPHSIRAIFNSDGLFLSNTSNPSGYTQQILLEPQAPVIGTQPVNTTVGYGDGCLFSNGVIVACNDNAFFTAAASGVPSPTVQWQVSTNNGFAYANISGATGATLSLKPGVSATGFFYRAVFTNPSGTATTNAARLTVNPAALVIRANDKVMAFHGTVPALDVTYGKPSTGAVLRNGDTPSSLTGTLTCSTTATSSSASGNYPITCSGLSSPNYTITDEQGTLIVADSTQTIHISTTAPTHALVGATYTPIATGGNSGNPVVFTIDPASTAGVCSVSPAGVVSFLSAGPNGVGFCFINANQAGTQFYPAAAQVQQQAIVYNAPPQITLQPVSQTVGSGHDVTFRSEGSGSALSIQWQVSTDGGATFSALIGATGADLTLTPTAAMTGYKYRVTYTNKTGPTTVQTAVSDVVTLTVYEALVFTSNTHDSAPITDCCGFTTSTGFGVRLKGVPKPTAQWQESSDGGATFADISGATNLVSLPAGLYEDGSQWSSDYSFNAVGARNGHKFRVKLTNTNETLYSNVATLTVWFPPSVVTNPTEQIKNAGETATFIAAGFGSPMPGVLWEVSSDGGASYGTIAGANDPTLTLGNVSSDMDGNLYRAIFTNGVQTGPNRETPAITTAALLTVYGPPTTSTATNSPTFSPTATPSNTPTRTPTATPSNTPTRTPTQSPTGTPTFTPTSTATSTPTATSTATPTTTATATYTATPTVPPPKPMVCYRAAGLQRSFAAQAVTVVDALGTATGRVMAPRWLCGLTSLDGSDPAAPTALGALNGYRLTTRARRAATQTVSDAFGTHTLDVTGPSRLLVPAVHRLSGVPEAAIRPAVDHFACYSVRKVDGGSRKGPRQMVMLDDLFGASNLKVGQPTRLCLPADVDGASPEAETHSDALLCYRLLPPRQLQGGSVFVTDDFGTATLVPYLRQELCMPATRQ